MTIKTKLACDGSSGGGGGGSSASDGELSVGSILLICVLSVLVLYCLIGYIICAKKNPDNGWGNVKANTPHLNFWCLVPKLAWAGCCVTKDFTMSKVNKMRGKGEGGGDYESVE